MKSTYNVAGLIAFVLLGVIVGVSNAWVAGATTPGKLVLAGVSSAAVAIAAFQVNKRKGGGAVDFSRIPVPIQDLMISLGDLVKEWRVEQKKQERQAIAAAKRQAETATQHAARLRAEADALEANANTGQPVGEPKQ